MATFRANLALPLPPIDAGRAPSGPQDVPLDRPAPNVHGNGIDGNSAFRPSLTIPAPKRTKGDRDGMGEGAPIDKRGTAVSGTLAAALALLPPILQQHAKRGKRSPEERSYLTSPEGQNELRAAMLAVFDPASGLSVSFDTVARFFVLGHRAERKWTNGQRRTSGTTHAAPGHEEYQDALALLWERETGCNLPPAAVEELRTGRVRKGAARKKGGPCVWPFAFLRRTARNLADREARAARKRTAGIVDSLATFGSSDAYSPDNVIRYLRECIGGTTGERSAVAMGKLLGGSGELTLTDNERRALSEARPRILALLSKGLDRRGAFIATKVLAQAAT